jgi:hypothetical protein
MIIWNLFFATVLLPLIGIALLWHRPRKPAANWLATVVLASGLVGFSVLVAPWGWFGLPLRFLIVLLFAIAVFGSWRRPVEDPPRKESPVRMIVKIVIGLFFGGVAAGVLQAHRVPPGAVDVMFPLRNGAYLVAQGGSTGPANMHAVHPQQRFALDIVQLNAAGFRARGIYPNAADRYAIFGSEIISPCAGEVISVENDLPDHQRAGTADEENAAGNHVLIRCGSIDVMLAHMKQGSVAVSPGETVAAGHRLALVGNSGNITEPHLHVHAQRGEQAVPLTFDGRWLVRNAIVSR